MSAYYTQLIPADIHELLADYMPYNMYAAWNQCKLFSASVADVEFTLDELCKDAVYCNDIKYLTPILLRYKELADRFVSEHLVLNLSENGELDANIEANWPQASINYHIRIQKYEHLKHTKWLKKSDVNILNALWESAIRYDRIYIIKFLDAADLRTKPHFDKAGKMPFAEYLPLAKSTNVIKWILSRAKYVEYFPPEGVGQTKAYADLKQHVYKAICNYIKTSNLILLEVYHYKRPLNIKTFPTWLSVFIPYKQGNIVYQTYYPHDSAQMTTLRNAIAAKDEGKRWLESVGYQVELFLSQKQ